MAGEAGAAGSTGNRGRARRPGGLWRFGILLVRGLVAVLRLRVTVTGAERLPTTGGAVLAMTHFGYLEFAFAALTTWNERRRAIRFLATKRAFDRPAVGLLLRSVRQIPVDLDAGAGAYTAAVTALRDGDLIGIFPEAGVDASFTVRPLKTGAARLAAQADVPLLPVAIWGGQRLLTKNHPIRMRDRLRVPVTIAFGPPVPTAGDPHAVSAALRETLQSLLTELRAAYPQSGAGQWWQPAFDGGTAPDPEAAADWDRRHEAERAARRRARGRG